MEKKERTSKEVEVKKIGIWQLVAVVYGGGLILLPGAFIALFRVMISYAEESATQQTTVITRCYDGDTCTTSEGEKIRLACIDTPELLWERANPIAAKAARDYLNELIGGNEVEIRRITKDSYGRTVAEVFKDGVDVQRLLLSKGHAQIYERYSDQCS